MDITQKLTNWIAWSSDGQKSVLKEALDEINNNRKRIETLREVVRDQHAYGVEQLKEIDLLREEIQELEQIMEENKCAVGYLITKRVLKQNGAWKQKESD